LEFVIENSSGVLERVASSFREGISFPDFSSWISISSTLLPILYDVDGEIEGFGPRGRQYCRV